MVSQPKIYMQLKKNKCFDHTPMRGEIDGVKVVAYKNKGRICRVCPDFGNKKKK